MCDQHRPLGPSVLELVVSSRMERAVAVVEDFSPGAEVKMENFDLDQGALQKHPFLPMIRSSIQVFPVSDCWWSYGPPIACHRPFPSLLCSFPPAFDCSSSFVMLKL